jgi:hypothetical protein
MKKSIKLKNTFIMMLNRVIIDLPAVERHLEGVIQVFLQFDKEYLVFPLESIPIYGIIPEIDEYIDIKRNQGYQKENGCLNKDNYGK